MGLIEIDGPKALELLAEAVEAKGEDYVYPRGDFDGCSYVRDDQPSCLVGHALFRAGLGVDVLRALDVGDYGDSDSAIGEVCKVSADLFGFAVTDAAERALRVAQASQDCGVPWGEALEAAKKAAGV